MRQSLLYAVSLLANLVAAVPSPEQEVSRIDYKLPLNPELPRLVLYYQTTHDSSGRPISLLPLVTELGIALTHLIVCSFHIQEKGVIHLNDFPPHQPMFYTLWKETAILKKSGVKILGMVGGAAAGSYRNSTLGGDDSTFEYYYGQLRDAIQEYELDGLDIDVEQPMSQAKINRLIRRLKYDFGSNFIISLAPVASALHGGSNLSGFNYLRLEADLRHKISFYNAQLYNGFGTLRNMSVIDRFYKFGWDLQKIVLGQTTSRKNAFGIVPFDELNSTLVAMRDRYGQNSIGGIMGWEYFNSEPFGTERPWRWAQIMTAILRPWARVKLSITHQKAVGLVETWMESSRARFAEIERLRVLERIKNCQEARRRNNAEGMVIYCRPVKPTTLVSAVVPDVWNMTLNVDYMAMVNA
ncbi:glycoside hydrolase superfamily [Podospora fimiseda]|uniref:Glycoside hydrolase superfamily n=1 Tax=Podospora fimiseda TaxID=252190 RepID=A0AAN7GVI1_9PEZI|nr:glycoside hydrolase superfamily [Podospora fimiseda]